MARVAGVDIPDNKRGEIALTYIFGIGNTSAKKILSEAGVDVNKKVQDWTDDEGGKIRSIIRENYKVTCHFSVVSTCYKKIHFRYFLK